MDLEKAEQAVYQLLEALGENPEREGLKETPARVVRMYQEMWQGLHKDPKDEFTAVFNEGNGEAVIVRDIPFYSMCEHHLVPFYGKAHIAYLPNTDGQVTGLS
ncbi:GTP cyclohydrolase I, partial [Streptococcus suis]